MLKEELGDEKVIEVINVMSIEKLNMAVMIAEGIHR
jgi:hypothetical protein